MSKSESLSGLPKDFTGQVRLFPLPNVVMFPHVVQPLHIFEPRYCEMLEEAIAGDQLLCMALLQPGWEGQYDERPAIYPVTCVGRVVAHTRLDNGRHNLLLMGLRRASLIRELPQDAAFRRAEVSILEDLYPAGGAPRRAKLRRGLLRSFESLVPDAGPDRPQFRQLYNAQLPLGVLADVLAYSTELGLPTKQQLLTEWNVDIRAGMLRERLSELAKRSSAPALPNDGFPPRFSSN